MQEIHGFIPQRCLMNFYPTNADEILQNFIEQYEIRALGQERYDLVGTRRDARFILLAHDLVTLLASERPCNPAPHCLCPELLAGNLLALGCVEELAVKNCGANIGWPG